MTLAVLMAGGKGMRLRPYTTILPKPLLPVKDKPIIEIILKKLEKENFEKVIITVGHLASLIQTYISQLKLNLEIEYFIEEKPLGTIGSLKNLEKKLPENFIVINSDILTDLKFKDFLKFHIENNKILTIATYTREVKIDFGIIEMDKNKTVKNYIEKPVLKYKVSMGIYAFKKEIVKFIPKQKFDFPQLVKKLLENKEKIQVYEHKGFWLDLGRKEDFEKIIKMNVSIPLY